MISKIKQAFLSLSVLGALLLPIAATAPALAVTAPAPAATDLTNNLCQGASLSLGTAANADSCKTPAAAKTLDGKIANGLNLASKILGVVAVIMIIVAGFKYVTSGGNKDGVSGAKNMIVYAIVGLIIVAIAQAIVQFVLTSTN